MRFELVIALGMLTLACTENETLLPRRPNYFDPTSEQGTEKNSTSSTCLAKQVEHIGLGGRSLQLSWLDGLAGEDRGRALTAASIEKKYQRIFGTLPSSFAGAAAAIQVPSTVGYSPPEVGAIAVSALYNAAYEAALAKLGSDPAFAEMPTETSAKAFCEAKAREAWLRVPTSEQITECVGLATIDSVDKSNPIDGTTTPTPAVERWAYVWALIVTAPPAITK